MEASFLPLPWWSVAAAVVAIILYQLYASSCRGYDVFKRLGISGPRPWPYIGTMLEYVNQSMAEGDMSRARTYGKVHGVFHGTNPILIVGDADLAEDILIKEFACFIDRPQFRSLQQEPMDRSINIACGDHWRHVRNTITPTFSSGKLKLMLSTIRNCAATLVAYVDKNIDKPVNPKDLFSGFTMDVIAGTAFGLDVKSLENPETPFLEHAKELFSFTSIRRPLRLLGVIVAFTSERLSIALYKLGLRVFDPVTVQYMESVVKEALNASKGSKDRANFAQLCMTQLVDINEVDPSTIRKTADGIVWTTKGLLLKDIVSNSIIFLLAGYDTTATFLSFFCYVMATNRDIQEKLYCEINNELAAGEPSYEQLKELPYLSMCIDETFRMYPPAIRLDRTCNKEVTVGGIRVPEGMKISVPVYAIHHDPDLWPDPYVFKPERFLPEVKAKLHPCSYLPFGAGPRNCIGARLALLEAKTAVVKLLQKYQICAGGDLPKPPLKFAAGFGLLTAAKSISVSFRQRLDAT